MLTILLKVKENQMSEIHTWYSWLSAYLEVNLFVFIVFGEKNRCL